ncbi:MAG: alpha-galactosidase [Bacteroidetes bacterium]|nr:alpha-galactosidase [Bacteroidota bacterium]
MKPLLALLLVLAVSTVHAQKFELRTARFSIGDNPAYSQLNYDDSKWSEIKTNVNWEEQGYPQYDGYGWYRFHIVMPTTIQNGNPIRFLLGKADDACEVFFNGVLIGKSGSFPTDKDGYKTTWDKLLEFRIDPTSKYIKWNEVNLISVRVYDGGGNGGLFEEYPYISSLEKIDAITLDPVTAADGKHSFQVKNTLNTPVEGTYSITCTDEDDLSVISKTDNNISLGINESKAIAVPLPKNKTHISYTCTFTESSTKKSLTAHLVLPYILTPKPGPEPKINGAAVSGVRINSPFLYKIPATGKKPLRYSAENLPAGFKVNPLNGVITGQLAQAGEYKITLVVKNSLGTVKKPFSIQCGNVLALTPPMGWNSWNCWGLSVSDEKLKASAKAMMDKGLIDHGWAYMNIDDGWEDEQRKANGEIAANKKFPDMKKLGDWLHSNGLKFGIYSSPGPRTCGGYLGSYQHEMQDASTYASWGIDYLKYDWCSYDQIHTKGDETLESYKKPYEVMRDALVQQKRDIVFSLCQYGMKDVWEWGETVNGNCWRTTGDITDTWKSLTSIGFNQTKQYPFAKPGRWNDPDMMIVGQVGWGEHLHNTRLTPDEQYTHVSLWSLLSAPLLIGCDLSKLDDFTLNLLTNDDVIAVNQDVLGKQAKQVRVTSTYQVWIKDLADGSKAVGIFNLGDNSDVIRFYWSELNVSKTQQVRDLWRQQDLGAFTNMFATRVPAHGVTLIKITAK